MTWKRQRPGWGPGARKKIRGPWTLPPRLRTVNLERDRREALRAACRGDSRAGREFLRGEHEAACIRTRLKWLAYLRG